MKQYQIIKTQDGNMLRPINPHPEKIRLDWTAIPETTCYNPEWQEFEKNSVDLTYIGIRKPGSVVSEGEIKEVRQARDSFIGSNWEDDEGQFNMMWEGMETRTAYTDTAPETSEWRTITLKMKVEPDLPHNEITLVNSKGDTFTAKSEGLLGFLHPEYYGR